VDQDDLPYFDTIDSLDEENLVTWSLTNSFITRNSVEDKDGTQSSKYKEIIWIKFYQSYNLTERDENPWSDLSLESEFNPVQYFSMTADIDWSPYTNHFTETHVGANINDNRGDSLRTYYRYTKDSLETSTDEALETLYTRLNVQLTETLAAYCSYESDLKLNENVESIVGFTLKKACWGIAVEFKDTSADTSISFLVTLNGIGGFGTQ